jgi:hypothetical protein
MIFHAGAGLRYGPFAAISRQYERYAAGEQHESKQHQAKQSISKFNISSLKMWLIEAKSKLSTAQRNRCGPT